MAPTPSAEARVLLDVARGSIEHGVRHGCPLPVQVEQHAPALRELRATFVTLERGGELRGCTGSLEASWPLVEAVARCAFRSAFHDPRFPPVEAAELDELELHISVLGPLEALRVDSEKELLARLRPGIDGLVLREGAAVGTFLPQVWGSLPEPSRFVAELKRKAGLPADHWSDRLELQRYQVEEISRPWDPPSRS
jgi:AmmeMemoRadiSam system protein A